MTAVDHAARIAEVLAEHRCRDVHGYRFDPQGDLRFVDPSPCESCKGWAVHVSKALVAAGFGVLPEATVTEEWGLEAADGDRCCTSEDLARKIADGDTGYTLGVDRSPIVAALRRKRIVRHSEHVTEWEAVE